MERLLWFEEWWRNKNVGEEEGLLVDHSYAHSREEESQDRTLKNMINELDILLFDQRIVHLMLKDVVA